MTEEFANFLYSGFRVFLRSSRGEGANAATVLSAVTSFSIAVMGPILARMADGEARDVNIECLADGFRRGLCEVGAEYDAGVGEPPEGGAIGWQRGVTDV
jgi:hypothetical protein